jgi:hypothetical protein
MSDDSSFENNDDSDQIEGLDVAPSESWGDYPLDTVFVRKDARSVSEVVKRIRNGRYKLDPEFQRDFVWSAVQQERLIESSLMRIPLPVLYVAEDTDGKIIVVDGLQRLTTFYKYMNDDFALKSIGRNDPESEVTNKKFSELSLKLKERIEDTQLTLYILDSKAPERARLDIFERVNSGVPLTRQQMRNCLYSGEATRWLKKAADSEFFLDSTGRSLRPKTMRDREVINRFCAFYSLGYEGFKGDMEEYLAEVLLKMNAMSADDLNVMFDDFKSAMLLSFNLFGKHSFRKSLATARNDDSKSVLNISLFEVMATVLAKNHLVLSKIDSNELNARFVALLRYDKLVDSISLSTNNTHKVRIRHSLLELAMIKHLDLTISAIIFYDVVKTFMNAASIIYDESKLIMLADDIDSSFDSISAFPDWSVREDLTSEFNSDIIKLLEPYSLTEVQLDLIYKLLFREARLYNGL